MDLPVPYPLKPMLAKAADGIPEGDWLFEPKWDGFRCIVFRDGDEVELGSRNEKPLTRYFPDLIEPLKVALPERCVVDGEVVVAVDDRLDFDALGQRIHPAASRVRMLAETTPADFVAFDLVALGDEALLERSFAERRRMLAGAVHPGPRVHVTPVTADREVAADWFRRVEGAGLDGLIAKAPTGVYEPDRRVLLKVKHQRTADCVVAGFRWHKDGNGVGSLLLGLHAGEGALQHVGVAASFTARRRAELVDELSPLIEGALEAHPWRDWADAEAQASGRMPGAPSRWNSSKDQAWIPLRIERVAEVGYGILTAGRFRGTTRFVRWRPDKEPAECGYDQLEVVPPLGFGAVLGGA